MPGVLTGQRTLNQLFDLIGAVVDGLRHQPAAGNNPVGSPAVTRLFNRLRQVVIERSLVKCGGFASRSWAIGHLLISRSRQKRAQ